MTAKPTIGNAQYLSRRIKATTMKTNPQTIGTGHSNVHSMVKSKLSKTYWDKIIKHKITGAAIDKLPKMGARFRAGVDSVVTMSMLPPTKAEPPPTRDVNRDSGTDSANGGWLRRVRLHVN